MAKNMNPTKVITGKDTRWSYCNVWDAKSINGGTPKYSVSLIIPKSDTATVQKIRAAIEAAYRDGENKLRGNGKTVPPLVAIKNPLRDGDTERPDDPAYQVGDKVTFRGERYVCILAHCVWSPADYPAAWKKQSATT